MIDFNTSTPQLKAVKDWIDAYLTLDINKVEPLASKNFEYHPFPETTEFFKESREKHLETFGQLLAATNKFEVICHEVIEAPGKVVLHATATLTTVSGVTLSLETFGIITLVEEDGELKILHCKDFADPRKRNAVIAGAIKAATGRVAA